METLLLIILGAGLIILWRRTDALEARVRSFEDTAEGLRSLLAKGDGGHEVQPAAKTATDVDQSMARTSKEADAAVPATRVDSDGVDVPSIIEAEKLPKSLAQPTGTPKTAWSTAFPAIAKPGFPKFKIDFEDIFGRLLPIWAGGIALAVAGFFLVRYSIEQGLLGPEVRVAMSFVFGVVLLGVAELAYRQEHRIADPRVRQALAGAGLATLYASFYLAGSHYGLIGSAVAFLGLAGVTGAAILLSFRFGLPCAVLGLVGGFAAPVLVDSQEPNVAMLALYLALVTGGLTYAGNRQGRSWLALAALAGGLGWGALILFTGLTAMGDLLAIGGYLVVIGAIIPALTNGRDASPIIRIGAAGLAASQMAFMVQEAGFSLLAWGLYGLLSAALSFFAWTEPKLREAAAFAAGLGVMMLALWSDVAVGTFTAVGLGGGAIFVGVPLANIWRGAHRALDALQVATVSLGLIGVTYLHFAWLGNDTLLAAVCFGVAVLPSLAAWMLWTADDSRVPETCIANITAGAIGAALAGLIAAPMWAAPIVLSVVTIALIALGWKRLSDYGLHTVMWLGAASSVIALMITWEFYAIADVMQESLRWASVGAVFIALIVRGGNRFWMGIGEVAAVLSLFALTVHLIPEAWLGMTLGWVVASATAGLAYLQINRTSARMTLIMLAVILAAEPILHWSTYAAGSLFGEPMLVAGELGWKAIFVGFIPLLVAVATLAWRVPERLKNAMPAVLSITAGIAVVAIHMLYKQAMGLETAADFTAFGLIERTMWQASLLGLAWAAIRYLSGNAWAQPVGLTLCGAAFVHFAYFSTLLHNPLWASQSVGSWPVVNMLIPSYAIGLGAVMLLRHSLHESRLTKPWMFDAVSMLLIALLALSELRHAFAGNILSDDPVGQTEDLLRSLLGIVLAIGFLLWGARTETRSWRLGSLVLILIAVVKVFLFDTAGLEGLARIASFMALGFSLIGIGWFYTRQLTRPNATFQPGTEAVESP